MANLGFHEKRSCQTQLLMLKDDILQAIQIIHRRKCRFEDTLMGDLVKTFIGPSRRIKCLEVEGRSRYFRHASLLLEQLDIQHPVYQYVISISSEFRKRYGERAADDLLHFIHSWSRVITDLIELGIPMTDITFHMKAVITECVEHIKTKTLRISEAILANQESMNDSTAPLNNCTHQESIYNAPLNDLVKEDSSSDVAKGLETEKKEESKAQNTDIVHQNEEMPFGLNCRSCENENKTKMTDSNNLTEESVEVIHLEMKNITSETEEDDISWFFDDVGSTDRILEMDEKSQEVQTGENAAFAAAADEGSGDEGNSDDSGAILTDIEQLKRDIESDLKKIKGKKERMKQLNVIETTCNVSKSIDKLNAEIDEEFDSCFDLSDSEFCDCFEEKNVKVFKESNKNRAVEKKCASNTDAEGFKSIELKFAKNKKDNEEVSVSKLYSELIGAVKYQTSVVDTPLAKRNSSLDIEIQMCQREFYKTQEMLKCFESHLGNKDTGKHIEESMLSKSDENQSLELGSACRHNGGVISGNEEITASVKTDVQEYLETFKSNDFDRWKLTQKPPGEGKIQQINSLLDSVRKGCKSGVSEARMSRLKFHSRYFQDSEYEEQSEKTDFSQTDQTKPPDLTKRSVNGTDCNSVQNQIISETGSETLSNSSDTGSNSSVKPDRNLMVKPKSPANCVDINDINNILKDINRISSANTCMKEDMHSSDLLGNYSDIPRINRLHIKQDLLKEVKEQRNMSQSDSENALRLPSSRVSNILMRSRHMNTENEMPRKTSPEGASDLLELEDEENICQKSKQIQEIMNADRHQIFEKTAVTVEMENEIVNTNNLRVLKDDISRLVKGVNYDGDENISKAVTDVILKQSGGGKPRLNLDLVDCYCRECINEPPKVIDGVVVKASLDTIISLIQKHPGKQFRALLVNGDLTDTFRHKGYKSVNMKKFSMVDGLGSGKCLSIFDGWLKDVLHTLEELSVSVLLVKGIISEDVLSVCGTLDIVTIDAVSYKQLVQLSEAAQVDMVTYLTLATQENVCTGLSISPLQDNWCDSVSLWNCKQEVVISLTGNNPQTVVICGITPMLTDLMEQELWDCLHHVSSALHCGYFLLGAGKTEEECALFLNKNLALRGDQNSAWDQDIQYKQLVLESMIASLNSYVHLFNDSEHMSGYALEGFSSRIETWKTALDVVITINSIDSFVTTGLTEEQIDIGTL